MLGMTRKVIIDCDPGIDDAFALALALFDPRLEVIAVTATAGNVSADVATKNVQAIIEQLDPPRYPRLGAASPHDDAPRVDPRPFHGDDGLGNASFTCSSHHNQHPSEKVICDQVRAAPEQITILCFGPLTNLARAFQRDPAIASMVGRVIIMGGSIQIGGNVTAAAEFNMYYDPQSARKVVRSPVTKTLIPLDVSRQMSMNLSFLEQLPSENTRAGRLLRKIVPFMFRAYRQNLGQESIHLHDIFAYLAAVQPGLFHMHDMNCDIETRGELTTGQTVFDRRRYGNSRGNMEVAVEVDVAGAMDCLLRGMQHLEQCT
ncbi:MAG: hypothetical protein RIS70_3338 [Planctomycetota bacterium]